VYVICIYSYTYIYNIHTYKYFMCIYIYISSVCVYFSYIRNMTSPKVEDYLRRSEQWAAWKINGQRVGLRHQRGVERFFSHFSNFNMLSLIISIYFDSLSQQFKIAISHWTSFKRSKCFCVYMDRPFLCSFESLFVATHADESMCSMYN
jgi:hypothetical protein